jgi:hypothetical protein
MFDLRKDWEGQVLGEMIVKSAQALKKSDSYLSYADLRERWRLYRQAYWKEHATEKGEDNTEWNNREEASLDDCLIELRRGQIMFQGHQWTCRECHHKNWIDLNSLCFELSCEVCKEKSKRQ